MIKGGEGERGRERDVTARGYQERREKMKIETEFFFMLINGTYEQIYASQMT